MRKNLPSAILKPSATVVRFTDAKPRKNVGAPRAACRDDAAVITLPVVRIERGPESLLDSGTLVTFPETPAVP